MLNLEAGEISIGVSDTICKYFLVPCIEEFYSMYPNVKIKIINRTSSGITQLINKGQIDLGIVTLPLELDGIHIEPFIDVEDIFVASNKYCELKNRLVSLKELADFPLLLLYKASRTRENLDQVFNSLGTDLNSFIEFESVDLLVEFAKIGTGIAHVLKESAKASLKKGTIFQIKIKENLRKRNLGIAHLKGGPLSLGAKLFIKELKQKKQFK